MLIKILMYCSEFAVTCLVNDINDMERLFNTYNPLLGKVFDEKCFLTNSFCKKTENIDISVANYEKAYRTRVV